MMIRRLHLSVIVLVAVGLWGALLVVNGVAVQVTWLRPFSTVVGLLLLLLVAFDLWAWRWRFLHGWFVPRPDLRGTWQIQLNSNWKNPGAEQTIAPITAYLIVRQTFSSLSMRMVTAESASELLGAEIRKAEDGTYRVAGVYLNEPKLSVRDRSPIHYGAILLDVAGDPANSLSGHYWTDRDSRGELFSDGRHCRAATSFNNAQTMFSTPVPPTLTNGQ